MQLKHPDHALVTGCSTPWNASIKKVQYLLLLTCHKRKKDIVFQHRAFHLWYFGLIVVQRSDGLWSFLQLEHEQTHDVLYSMSIFRVFWRTSRETSWSSLRLRMLQRPAWPWRNTRRSDCHLAPYLRLTVSVIYRQQNRNQLVIFYFIYFFFRWSQTCGLWPFCIDRCSSGMWERQRSHPPLCCQRKGVWRNRFW